MATESQILRTSTRFARAKHFYYGFGRYTIKVQIIFHRTRPWLLLLRLLGAASTWGLASNENWWHTCVWLWSTGDISVSNSNPSSSQVSCNGPNYGSNFPGTIFGMYILLFILFSSKFQILVS